MGHEVTLFASGDSVTQAKLVAACPQSLWRNPDCRETLPHHVRLMDMVFEDVSRFDVIHFHTDYLHFPLLRRYPCSSVTTIHGRLHASDLKPLFEEHVDAPLISISDNQRVPVPEANWAATVYHGLPRGLHTFRRRPDDYLAFLGRISPEKRLDRAIEKLSDFEWLVFTSANAARFFLKRCRMLGQWPDPEVVEHWGLKWGPGSRAAR